LLEGPDPGVASQPTGAEPLVLTARRRGVVVGLARGWCHDDRREIESLLVAPDERGQGIGRQLELAFASA
jgi:hypothetical protein